LAGKALGDKRSGDAATDNEGIAFEVLTDLESGGVPGRFIPWRPTASQIGLFGIL
jgi:hypothetical protein